MTPPKKKEEENTSNVYLAKDVIFHEVLKHGAKPVMEPTTEEWGQRTCYVSDPEGNLIEIGSFIK